MIKLNFVYSCHGCTRDCLKIYELHEAERDIKSLFYFEVCVGYHRHCKKQGIKDVSLL